MWVYFLLQYGEHKYVHVMSGKNFVSDVRSITESKDGNNLQKYTLA